MRLVPGPLHGPLQPALPPGPPLRTLMIMIIILIILNIRILRIILIILMILIILIIIIVYVSNTVRVYSMIRPSPPIKSLDFRGLASSRLLILRGGNSHVR